MKKDNTEDFFQSEPYQELSEKLPYEQKQELASVVGLAINSGLNKGIEIVLGVNNGK